jgi:mRNA interferase MazF
VILLATYKCTEPSLSRVKVVLEPDDDPVPRRSSINLDSVESVSVAVLVERLGRLSDDRMREVCAALDVAVECHG